MSDSMIDISKYMQVYLQVKNRKNFSRDKAEDIFRKIFLKKYNTVCMDIDKTVTNGEHIDDEMLNLIFEILRQNKNVCFITGRGRKISKEVLSKLYKEAIIRGIDIKNITCCTGNGAIYMYSKDGFLDKEESIVTKEKIEKYKEQKELLRNLYIKELEKNAVVNINPDLLKKRSVESSGKLSLRFPINIEEIVENADMMQILNEILLKTDLVDKYYTSKSIFKDKIIFEISLANKKMAIEFLADKLEENKNNIIRIGDQGRKYGNDFAMLNCLQGFSVDEIESETLGVLPVMGIEGTRLRGINATKKTLEDLIIEK